MNLPTVREGDTFTVTLNEPRLDALCSSGFRHALQECVAQGGQRLVVDLSATRFIDSSGLGALVSVLRKLSGPGSLVLRGVTPSVERALRLARLDRILVIEPQPEPQS
jgi:anti-sigma B factor antagonist